MHNPRPWDRRVHRPHVFGDLLRRGSLALGEGYVNGDWDCDALDVLLTQLLGVPATRHAASLIAWSRSSCLSMWDAKTIERLFDILDSCLADEGLVLMKPIGSPDTYSLLDAWINTDVFPNGRLPSDQQLCRGFEPWFLRQDR